MIKWIDKLNVWLKIMEGSYYLLIRKGSLMYLFIIDKIIN